jgi:hypothetical protein
VTWSGQQSRIVLYDLVWNNARLLPLHSGACTKHDSPEMTNAGTHSRNHNLESVELQEGIAPPELTASLGSMKQVHIPSTLLFCITIPTITTMLSLERLVTWKYLLERDARKKKASDVSSSRR